MLELNFDETFLPVKEVRLDVFVAFIRSLEMKESFFKLFFF